MAKYIRIEDKQYPFTEKDIKNLFANTSFPTPFRAKGFEVVFPVPQPELTSLQRAVKGEPEISVKGTWQQTWNVVNKFKAYTDEDGVSHTKKAQETAFLTTLAEQEAQKVSDAALVVLKDLDLKSIRSIREYIAAKENAPKFLKDYETQAIDERVKMKK